MCEDLTFKPYPPPVDLDRIQKEIEEIKARKPWEPQFPNHAWLMLTVQVFRDYGNGWMDVCDDDGNCLRVSKKNLNKPFSEHYNKEQLMKQMKDAVLTVAKGLLKANNTVTTLEIKLELRRDYGYYFWTQKVVSDYMDQFAGDGIFTYIDNGTYRIYSLASPAFKAATAGPVSSSLAGSTKVIGKVKRGRPRKIITTTSAYVPITKKTAYQLATGDKGFESITIDGVVVTRLMIRTQKKSVIGYLTPSKLNKVSEIKVSGTTYPVV